MSFRAHGAFGIALVAAVLVSTGAARAHELRASTTPGSVPAVDVQNSSLTPGAVLPVSRSQVCRSGYSASVRNVPSSEATAVYTEYHVRHLPYAHEVDHLISLELGGSNAIRNLWPEPYAGVWGARTKDKLENRLHALVCAGSLTLQAAQRAISVDWVAAYQRYVAGTPAPAVTAAPPSATTSSPSVPVDPGGFYASSYGSASTIYCADDSGWKRLSASYLRHFSSWAAAIAAFPSYHQHQPC